MANHTPCSIIIIWPSMLRSVVIVVILYTLVTQIEYDFVILYIKYDEMFGIL